MNSFLDAEEKYIKEIKILKNDVLITDLQSISVCLILIEIYFIIYIVICNYILKTFQSQRNIFTDVDMLNNGKDGYFVLQTKMNDFLQKDINTAVDKATKCGTFGCDGKGNTRGGLTHRSSKSCPNKDRIQPNSDSLQNNKLINGNDSENESNISATFDEKIVFEEKPFNHNIFNIESFIELQKSIDFFQEQNMDLNKKLKILQIECESAAQENKKVWKNILLTMIY